ncbi:MAG: CarD family transcriptional regulator [Oligoflexales bacterium]|nr:CarD family transcriptional regulator [Oligoflexales bacterium]
MEYIPGKKVVHKTHGVGTISGIEITNYGAGLQEYYLLKIDSTGLVVRFPKQGGSCVIRNLANEGEISKVYSILGSPTRNYSSVWNRRKKEFTEKIKSGSLYDIAEVLRDLSRISFNKELSSGEKEMLEKAKDRIVTEISAAKSSEKRQVEMELINLIRSN